MLQSMHLGTIDYFNEPKTVGYVRGLADGALYIFVAGVSAPREWLATLPVGSGVRFWLDEHYRAVNIKPARLGELNPTWTLRSQRVVRPGKS